MCKKGFTLIELMGVVIILSLLILIAVPVVDKYIKNTNQTAAEVQKDAVLLAAKNWASDNAENIDASTKSTIVTIDTLKELGYLDYEINLEKFKEDGKKLSVYNSVKITLKENGRFSYELIESAVVDSVPTNLRLTLVSSSFNSLTVKASATDKSAILKYEFNIDGNKNSDGGLVWEGGTGATTYTFKDISEGEHTVIFRVINSNNRQSESKKYTFNTREGSRLTFLMKDMVNDCSSDNGVVRLIFPADSTERGYIIGGIEKNVTIPSVDIDVHFNSVITAWAFVDGVKIMETYNVSATNENGEVIDCFAGGTE